MLFSIKRLLAFMLALFLGSVSALAYAEPLLFLTNSTSSSRGKFSALDKIAQSHGVDTEVMYFNDLPKELDAALFKKYSVIWVDSFIPALAANSLTKRLKKQAYPLVLCPPKENHAASTCRKISCNA